jgi:hypothetical protein
MEQFQNLRDVRTDHTYVRQRSHISIASMTITGYTGQQNLTFFVPRGKISNPDSTFNTEFKYVRSFSLSPTVFL